MHRFAGQLLFPCDQFALLARMPAVASVTSLHACTAPWLAACSHSYEEIEQIMCAISWKVVQLMRSIVGNHGDKRGMRRLLRGKIKKVMRKEKRTGGSITHL